jgi:hypothetical protein
MWEETCVYIYNGYRRALLCITSNRSLLDQSRTKGYQAVVRSPNAACHIVI